MTDVKNRMLAVLVISLLFLPGIVQAQDKSDRFTNEAGNPIMAGDLDRVSQRSTASDSPVWAEGHSWEPRRDDPHTLRKILEQQRLQSKHKSFIPRVRYFLFLVLVGALLVRGLLGWIVYRDIQTLGYRLSVMWIPVVLLSGTLGAVAYGVFRMSAMAND